MTLYISNMKKEIRGRKSEANPDRWVITKGGKTAGPTERNFESFPSLYALKCCVVQQRLSFGHRLCFASNIIGTQNNTPWISSRPQMGEASVSSKVC